MKDYAYGQRGKESWIQTKTSSEKEDQQCTYYDVQHQGKNREGKGNYQDLYWKKMFTETFSNSC